MSYREESLSMLVPLQFVDQQVFYEEHKNMLTETQLRYHPLHHTQKMFDEMPDRDDSGFQLSKLKDNVFIYLNAMFCPKVYVCLTQRVDWMFRSLLAFKGGTNSTISKVLMLPNEEKHFTSEIMGVGYDYSGYEHSIGSIVVNVLEGFSIVSLLRVNYCLLGYHHSGVKCLVFIDSRQSRGIYTNDIRSVVSIISECEKILKKSEHMFGLLAICLSLCPQGNLSAVDVHRQLWTNYGQKIWQMQRYDNEACEWLVWKVSLYQAYARDLTDISGVQVSVVPVKQDSVSSRKCQKHIYVYPSYASIICFSSRFVQFMAIFKGLTMVIYGDKHSTLCFLLNSELIVSVYAGGPTMWKKIIDIHDCENSNTIFPRCSGSNLETVWDLFPLGCLNIKKFWVIVGAIDNVNCMHILICKGRVHVITVAVKPLFILLRFYSYCGKTRFTSDMVVLYTLVNGTGEHHVLPFRSYIVFFFLGLSVRPPPSAPIMNVQQILVDSTCFQVMYELNDFYDYTLIEGSHQPVL